MEKKTEKEEKYMKELQDRYIRFDWAIKRLLRQKANFGVLEGFLTVFLGEQIKIEEILESEGYQQMADEKFNRVDIKAKNTKGDIIWNVCFMAWRRPSPNIFIWDRTIPG